MTKEKKQYQKKLRNVNAMIYSSNISQKSDGKVQGEVLQVPEEMTQEPRPRYICEFIMDAVRNNVNLMEVVMLSEDQIGRIAEKATPIAVPMGKELTRIGERD